MLTGEIPRGRFELPSQMLPQLDARLDAVIDKAMQRDRDKRYSSALLQRAGPARRPGCDHGDAAGDAEHDGLGGFPWERWPPAGSSLTAAKRRK